MGSSVFWNGHMTVKCRAGMDTSKWNSDWNETGYDPINVVWGYTGE